VDFGLQRTVNAVIFVALIAIATAEIEGGLSAKQKVKRGSGANGELGVREEGLARMESVA